MNDKPKDRTKKWMKIIAFNLGPLIVFALGALIYVIVTGDYIGPIVFSLLCLVFLAIALRMIMREKRDYKPKDRTTMRMSIIALILVLISALGVVRYVAVTGGDGMGGVFSLLCLVSLAIALRWKAVGGVFFVLIGLLFVYFGVDNIITYGIESLIEEIFYFVCGGLLLIIVGLLFLAVWRRKREAKVPTSSD